MYNGHWPISWGEHLRRVQVKKEEEKSTGVYEYHYNHVIEYTCITLICLKLTHTFILAAFFLRLYKSIEVQRYEVQRYKSIIEVQRYKVYRGAEI